MILQVYFISTGADFLYNMHFVIDIRTHCKLIRTYTSKFAASVAPAVEKALIGIKWHSDLFED